MSSRFLWNIFLRCEFYFSIPVWEENYLTGNFQSFRKAKPAFQLVIVYPASYSALKAREVQVFSFVFCFMDFLIFNRSRAIEVGCAIIAVVGGSTVNKTQESSTQFLGLCLVPSRYFSKFGRYPSPLVPM